ncbi:DEKNAAC102209 [Brettanomyces naardenensis]|uniref:DEKNAAC102209 n=1 Tax=Brettanomyces naardenensis TaxID=13370 RepID=A0A448YKE6_BRENA|nr:DEKNAAC102209 [Brettanomyces naardenensis]
MSKPETFHDEQSDDGSNAPADILDFDASCLADIDESPTFLGFSGKKLQFATVLMGSVGFLLFGYDQGVMGSLLTLPAFRETFPAIDTTTHPSQHTSTMQGFVIAVYEIGCLIGALFNLRFSDAYGRLKATFLGCLLMIIGAILQCSSFSIAQFVVGRVVTGLGNGLITSSIPVYESETTRPEVRGKMVMLFGVVNVGGVALSYWLDFAFFFTHSSVSFRFPIAFQMIFPISIVPWLLKLPESPRWLARKGRFLDAARSFAALEGTNVKDPNVIAEVERVRQSLIEERDASKGINMRHALFSQGKHRNFHRLCLGLWSQILQQLTGINVISYYCGTIFQNFIGMSPLMSRILAACNGTEYFLFCFVPYFFIERWGRRVLMMLGSTGECLSMLLLTIFSYRADHGGGSGMGIGAAVMLFVFNSSFAFGWLGMTWLLPAELTPLSIRAPANAITTAGNWSFNFMVVMITPIAFNNIKSFTYLIFAVLNFLTIPAVYVFYPETKERSLEEMDEIFGKCPVWKPWQVVGIAKRTPYEKKTFTYADIEHALNLEKAEVEEEREIEATN